MPHILSVVHVMFRCPTTDVRAAVGVPHEVWDHRMGCGILGSLGYGLCSAWRIAAIPWRGMQITSSQPQWRDADAFCLQSAVWSARICRSSALGHLGHLGRALAPRVCWRFFGGFWRWGKAEMKRFGASFFGKPESVGIRYGTRIMRLARLWAEAERSKEWVYVLRLATQTPTLMKATPPPYGNPVFPVQPRTVARTVGSQNHSTEIGNIRHPFVSFSCPPLCS